MLRRQTDEKDPRDWFWFAEERLKGADLLWQHAGLSPLGIESLQEAVERYLRGFLIAKGWRLKRIHDLTKLVEEAIAYEPRFSAFLDLADELTKDFFAQHYPGGDLTDVGENYEHLRQQTGVLVVLIKELLPQPFVS